MDALRIPRFRGPVRRGKWVAWQKPGRERWKLNTDGSKKWKSTSGGGILRDENGDFVYGFSHPYTHSEIIHAELQAIIDGIIYIQTMGIGNLIIETDSAVAFEMIKKTQPP